MYCMYPGHFFLQKRHFFLQTINSPCDIFQVFQQVEHESYLLGTKSHLCKKYVFAEAIGVTRHVHRYVHISHNGRICQFLAKKYESVLPLRQPIQKLLIRIIAKLWTIRTSFEILCCYYLSIKKSDWLTKGPYFNYVSTFFD